MCIFAPVHKLLDYVRTLGFGPILLRWRPNMWDFSATFAFCIEANGLATFFDVPKNCIFWGTFFELIKKVASLFAEKLQGFNGNLLYHCYILLNGIATWNNPRALSLVTYTWIYTYTYSYTYKYMYMYTYTCTCTCTYTYMYTYTYTYADTYTYT